MVKKYCRIFTMRISVMALVFLIGLSGLFVPFFTSDLDTEDTLLCLFPLYVSGTTFLVALLYPIRFRRMIKKQEELYGVSFNDDEVVLLEKMLFLSRDWLIAAGTCAVYKKHIRDVRSVFRTGKGGSSYEVFIITADGKQCKVWCTDAENIKKIREWKNSNLYS